MKLIAYLVRHGSTTLNDQDKFRGPVDVDLDDNGREQAAELAKFFKGQDFSAAFHSSKKRTKQTIDPILKGKRIKPKTVKDFDALNVGDLSGKPKNEENMKKMEYYQEHPNEKIPGGERLNDFRKRTDPKIMMVIKKGESSKSPTLSVVHSSIIHEAGHLFHEDHTHALVKPGGVVGIFKGPNGYEAKALLHKEDKKSEQFAS